jgi:hypothetical protein
MCPPPRPVATRAKTLNRAQESAPDVDKPTIGSPAPLGARPEGRYLPPSPASARIGSAESLSAASTVLRAELPTEAAWKIDFVLHACPSACRSIVTAPQATCWSRPAHIWQDSQGGLCPPSGRWRELALFFAQSQSAVFLVILLLHSS